MNPAHPRTLGEIPLWRLLVMLHDAEHASGPDSETARTIARHIEERMRSAAALGLEDEADE